MIVEKDGQRVANLLVQSAMKFRVKLAAFMVPKSVAEDVMTLQAVYESLATRRRMCLLLVLGRKREYPSAQSSSPPNAVRCSGTPAEATTEDHVCLP